MKTLDATVKRFALPGKKFRREKFYKSAFKQFCKNRFCDILSKDILCAGNLRGLSYRKESSDSAVFSAKEENMYGKKAAIYMLYEPFSARRKFERRIAPFFPQTGVSYPLPFVDRFAAEV